MSIKTALKTLALVGAFLVANYLIHSEATELAAQGIYPEMRCMEPGQYCEWSISFVCNECDCDPTKLGCP